MALSTQEHPWLTMLALTATWLVIWVAIEALLWNGDVLGAAIQGAVSGITFGAVYVYVDQQQ